MATRPLTSVREEKLPRGKLLNIIRLFFQIFSTFRRWWRLPYAALSV
jgi:hypothetical protein